MEPQSESGDYLPGAKEIWIMRRLRFLLSFLALAWIAGTAAFAQTTGQIEGFVLDNASKPLPGVKVIATSPALMGERGVVSDKNGKYVLQALPTGTFSLQFEITGYQKTQVPNILLGLGQIVRQNVNLKEGEMVESVTVKAGIPLIDRKTADTSVNFGTETLNQLPTAARSFRDITKFVPSITSVDLNTTDGGRAGFPSIRGEGQYGDNYLIDGLTMRDPSIKTTTTPVPYDSIKEIQVITDGYSPEYGQALGGTINVITKTGSNKLSGEVAEIYKDDSTQAAAANTLGPSGSHQSEPYANIGGAILKDKLWYFGSYNRLDAVDKFASHDVPLFGTLAGGKIDDASNTGFGKLAYSINPNHTVSSNYAYRKFTEDGQNTDIATPEARQSQGITDKRLRLDYTALFTSSSVFEVHYGFLRRALNTIPVSPRDLAQYEFTDPGIFTNNAWRLSKDERNRDDYSAVFTQTWNPGKAAGSHEFKGGIEFHDIDQKSADVFTGTGEDVFSISAPGTIDEGMPDGFKDGTKFQFVGGPGGIEVPSNLNEYAAGGFLTNASKEKGIFVQDRYEIGDFNIMVGVRADNQRGFNDLGTVFYKADYRDTLAPRGSITWDATSDGKNIFKGAWGRFYDVTSTRFGEFANSRSGFSFRTYLWAGSCASDFRGHIDDGGPCDIHLPDNWTFINEQSNAANPLDYSGVTEPPHMDRYLLEYDRQIGQNYAFKARYVSGRTRGLIDDVNFFYNDFRVINWSQKKRDYQSFEVEFNGNPSPNLSFNASYVRSAANGTNSGQFEASGFSGNSGNSADIGVYGDRPPSNVNGWLSIYPGTGVPASWVGNPQRDYNNDDVIDNKDRDFFIQKFVYAGLGALDGSDNWYGPLPYNISDQVKVNANFRAPKLWDMYFNAFLSWASGYSTERRGFQAVYGDYLTFSENFAGFTYTGACTTVANCTTNIDNPKLSGRDFTAGSGLKRGTLTNSSFWTLDVALGKVWSLGRDFNIEGRIDCFNLTNNQTIVAIQQRAVDSFGTPLLRTAPRQFRGTLRFQF